MLVKRKNDDRILDLTSRRDFGLLYSDFWEKVFAVCYHSTEDLELAKEMTQDIFKSIWERRHSLQVKKSYENYLVRAAKLKVAEHFRNQAIRKKYLDTVSQRLHVGANYTDQDVSYTLLNEELEQLVAQLPGQCRNVFQMSRNQGLTNRDIAERLQISQRAVEYHISKALHFLKKNLPEYEIS